MEGSWSHCCGSVTLDWHTDVGCRLQFVLSVGEPLIVLCIPVEYHCKTAAALPCVFVLGNDHCSVQNGVAWMNGIGHSESTFNLCSMSFWEWNVVGHSDFHLHSFWGSTDRSPDKLPFSFCHSRMILSRFKAPVLFSILILPALNLWHLCGCCQHYEHNFNAGLFVGLLICFRLVFSPRHKWP